MILFKGDERTVVLFYLFALVIALSMAFWAAKTGTEVVEGGERPETAFEFFGWVLVYTGIFLLLIYVLKRYVRYIIFLLELLFLFFTTYLFFGVFVSGAAGISWGLFLVLLRLLFPGNDFIRNTSVAFIGGVAAGLVGVSFSVLTALLLYVLLIAYDFFSVFVTGHMIKLAKGIEDVSERGEKVALGGGDLVLPALLSSSLVPVSGFVGVVSAASAVLGVLLTFRLLKRFRRPLPALPYIGAVQLTVTALSLSLSTLLL